ncbi:MAG: UDP-forming cellulose synthase catalytic subunit [Acidobacteriota bacterium]
MPDWSSASEAVSHAMVLSTTNVRLSRWIPGIGLLIVLFLPFVYSAIVVPLSPVQQALVAGALIGFAMLASTSRWMRPLIIFLSCFASMRYLYWRISSTLNFDTEWNGVVSVLLLGAEVYGLLILFLGYFQTIEVFKRTSPPLTRFPSVDVFVPTYNEPAEIVRRTVIGALAIDYPNKKVYLLDDGRRPEMRRLAEEVGCHYLTRPDNRHAKAGNLNNALQHTSGELLAIFDADHVPVRGFLQKTVGFFEDANVALVQTAQHFFNPDPYERNLHLTDRVAPEQSFFYHVIQPGNDFWNAAFFCGSCAVLRRSSIEAIGGFKTQTVTEDAHTALELHSRGFSSVYLPVPLAAGLATETFAAHVQQRMRWARGMAQILRIDCPLWKRGLSWPQRLNYFNAMLHFFFGIPRLIMILAPLTFLLLGLHPIKANALAVMAYILPHIGLSTIANSVLSKSYRQSFWASVYEVSIASYTAGVTLLALLNPRLGKFNVTDKGTCLGEARFDWRTSRTPLLLITLSVVALTVAFPLRLVWFSYHGKEASELHSILINTPWALANLLTLIAAACVAYEQPQQRRAPRVARDFLCVLDFGGLVVTGRSVTISETGVSVRLPRPLAVPQECSGWIRSEVDATLPVFRGRLRRVSCDWENDGQVLASFSFGQLDPYAHRRLVELIFCGDDSWTRHRYPRDQILRSFWYLVTTFWRVTEPRRPRQRQSPRLAGNWKAWCQDQECRCTSLSGLGALIRFDGASAVPSVGSKLRVAMGEERNIEASIGRVVALEGQAGGYGVQFEWPSPQLFSVFCDNLYRGHDPAFTRSHPTSDRPRWIPRRRWSLLRRA